ncbi:hypothetical protein QUH73_06980 [Labilibaculum sp. K2S]|nr:hypothetical protein [Labilibaculum sp. K2S]MDM8159549.1 hypothetical protein [Labilibaculum sp. K2S]
MAKNTEDTTNQQEDWQCLQLVNIAILTDRGVLKLQMDSLTF